MWCLWWVVWGEKVLCKEMKTITEDAGVTMSRNETGEFSKNEKQREIFRFYFVFHVQDVKERRRDRHQRTSLEFLLCGSQQPTQVTARWTATRDATQDRNTSVGSVIDRLRSTRSKTSAQSGLRCECKCLNMAEWLGNEKRFFMQCETRNKIIGQLAIARAIRSALSAFDPTNQLSPAPKKVRWTTQNYAINFKLIFPHEFLDEWDERGKNVVKLFFSLNGGYSSKGSNKFSVGKRRMRRRRNQCLIGFVEDDEKKGKR